MKRFAPLLLLASLALVIFAPLAMAAAAAATPTAPTPDKSPAGPIATAISTVTGIAISPLLGTAGFGVYKWATAKDDAERAKLPWFAQWKFFVPALLIVGICAFKDTLGTMVPPGLKKPLDVLETLENKFSGLVAAGAVIPLTMETVTGVLFGGKTSAVLPELATGSVATIHLAAFEPSSLLNILTVPFGVAVFCFVWLASHAINVLILLSPWGAIDAALKGARTALLGLITLTSTIDPWISAGLSLVVIVIAWLVAGWAFRLTVFGWIFSWEFVTRRCHRFTPAENENAMFAGDDLPAVPIRTYGRLVKKADGGLEFAYRPWLVLAPRVAPVPGEGRALAVGRGAFFSDVIDAQERTLFTLPPRYRGHEEALARIYALRGVQPAGLRKAWSSLREMFGHRVKNQAPLAS
ncbi:MAG: hypothetical protein JNK23_19145 [Opitutaceae bacterium]|nr:hypothetical protein [Opitutaceae bacterium]